MSTQSPTIITVLIGIAFCAIGGKRLSHEQNNLGNEPMSCGGLGLRFRIPSCQECLSTRTVQAACRPSPPSLAFGFERVLQHQSRVPLSLHLSLSPHDPLMKAAAAPSPIGRRRAPRGRGHALPLAGARGGRAREREEEREESARSRGCSPGLQTRDQARRKDHP